MPNLPGTSFGAIVYAIFDPDMIEIIMLAVSYPYRFRYQLRIWASTA